MKAHRAGRIVVLAGSSSSGKTTLGRKLQETLDGTWLLLGVDLMLWTLPPKLMHNSDGVAVRDGVIRRGDEFMRIFGAFRDAIAALARSGVDVLIDEVMLEASADQRLWDESLRGLDVCWIGVRCDPEIAAAREAARGDRPPGIARQQAMTVHDGVRYDVEVDNGSLEPAQALELITDTLRRRWGVHSAPATNEPPEYPVKSAWTNDSAPWES